MYNYKQYFIYFSFIYRQAILSAIHLGRTSSSAPCFYFRTPHLRNSKRGTLLCLIGSGGFCSFGNFWGQNTFFELVFLLFSQWNETQNCIFWKQLATRKPFRPPIAPLRIKYKKCVPIFWQIVPPPFYSTPTTIKSTKE